MIKRLLATLASLMTLFAAAAFAAVDVNKANQAELKAVKGVGPGIAGINLEERQRGAFKDWANFASRVKGVSEVSAVKFSGAGLTVGGVAYQGGSAWALAPRK